MKRLARILAILAGIGAIVWAMRDRLVSVAISREPQPPAFRMPEPAASPAEERPETTPAQTSPPPAEAPGVAGADGPDGDLTTISGIGPVYAGRLQDAGIETLRALASSPPEQVAEAAEVPLSRAAGWVESAKQQG